jgi:glycosyltransferase involved in cell wall biosynthesis
VATTNFCLKTPLAANTGYGNDGFALARYLSEAGLDVRLKPTFVGPPLPMGVAMMLVKDLEVEFDYLLHHVDPDQFGLTEGEKRLKAKKILWSMWEFTALEEHQRETMAEKLSAYDLFLAYDEVTAQSIGSYAEQAGVPVKILQGGFSADEWEPDPSARDWNGVFRFCMVGQLHARKNPFAAVKAFREVREKYGEKVELHLKTNVPTLPPQMEDAYPGLKIHYTSWSQSRLKAFYNGCHTYLATSWGEGKNLPALEAQAMGMPVIYSNFGGHRQWGSSDWGWPIGGQIEEHKPGMGSFRVDHDELVAAMCEAVENRFATRLKGEKAQSMVIAQNDWSKVVPRLLSLIS